MTPESNWRGLCEELVGWIERSTRHYIQDPDVLIRAREALALPEPEGRPASAPAEGEVVAWLRNMANADLGGIDELNADRAADLLSQRQPAPVPVAVSERLPGPEDCDSHGWCWVLYSGHSTWTLEPPYGQDGMPTGFTHWLPAHALPLPSGEVEHG